jgi:hypothetical protein
MAAQFIEGYGFSLELTPSNFPSIRMVAFGHEVLDYTLGVACDPGIFGNVNLSKCPSAENLNNLVMPV